MTMPSPHHHRIGSFAFDLRDLYAWSIFKGALCLRFRPAGEEIRLPGDPQTCELEFGRLDQAKNTSMLEAASPDIPRAAND